MDDFFLQLSKLPVVLSRHLASVLQDVSPQQWAVLLTLADNAEPMKHAEIAKRLGVTKQNMTGMIARLVELDLLKRNDDPKDLRSWRVELTRRGRSLVDRKRPAYDEWRTSVEREIAERDLQTVKRALEKLLATFESR